MRRALGGGVELLDEKDLEGIEQTHAGGLTAQGIVESFAARGIRFSEATFRKYVQLGLLPRSTRVGTKGRHRGSHGLYPVSTVRRINDIRRLQSLNFTIEEIQEQFFFARTEIDALERQIGRVFDGIEKAIRTRAAEAESLKSIIREVAEARELAERLVAKLGDIEGRLSVRARMARAAV